MLAVKSRPELTRVVNPRQRKRRAVQAILELDHPGGMGMGVHRPCLKAVRHGAFFLSVKPRRRPHISCCHTLQFSLGHRQTSLPHFLSSSFWCQRLSVYSRAVTASISASSLRNVPNHWDEHFKRIRKPDPSRFRGTLPLC